MDSQLVQDKAMHHLGQSRSSVQADHALLTPDTFVRAPLPGMKNATAIVHTAPAMGAGFTQYTAEMEKNGALGPAPSQRFLYVLDGEVVVEAAGKKRHLAHGGFAFIPHGAKSRISARAATHLAVIEKKYQKLKSVPAPRVLLGEEASVASEPLMDDADLQVRHLLPDEPAFDFAVNVMTYEPGAVLPMVESHVMEHGLLMLEGGGIYRLGDRWYPVTAGDFIWMGPYCLQWFGALGKIPAKYLIYKPWNRHPLE
jgi:(S)-ureidoglycine aminohydrolase